MRTLDTVPIIASASATALGEITYEPYLYYIGEGVDVRTGLKPFSTCGN